MKATQFKPLARVLLVLSLLLMSAYTHAYDQAWNGFREDITGPVKPSPPHCPSGKCTCDVAGSPVYIADGSLVWRDVDITFPTDTRVGLKRTYNSFDYRAGLFGRGWVTAQESNIARTYKAVTEGNADGSPKTATEFESVPIWLASHGHRFKLEETATECYPPEVWYFTFEKQADGRFMQVFEDSRSFTIYSATGALLESYSDEDGTTLYYEYDDQGRLVTQFDSYGNRLNFEYNEQGFVSSLTDQADRVWAYDYDVYGRLVQVLDPEGNTRDYGYQIVDKIGYKQHLLTEVNDNTDEPVLSVTWANRIIGSASLMRVASYTESDGHRHDYSYAQTTYAGKPAIRAVKETKQIGSNTTIESQTFIADASNYLILSKVNNTGNITKLSAFDEQGNLIEKTDERGNVTQYRYNSVGRRIKTTELAGTGDAREITVSYWNNTERKAAVNEYGVRETRYTYDDELRILSKSQVDLATQIERTWDYTYHPNSTDSQGNQVLGKVATIDGPQPGPQDTTSFTYDEQGRLTRKDQPHGHSTVYTYNATGQQITQTDANGVLSEMTYDSRNRLTSTKTNGRITAYKFDAQNQLTQLTDELGRVTTITYGDYNQPVQMHYPSGDYLSFSYAYGAAYTEVTQRYTQAGGELISTNIVRNDPISGLPLQEYLAGATQQVSNNQYNGVDELEQTTLYGQFGNTTGTTTSVYNYSYDYAGRLIQIEDGANGLTNMAYDDFGQLTGVTDANNGTTTYDYLAWGEQSQLNSPDTGTSDYQYDTAGNLVQQTNANNLQADYSYDASNRITGIDYAGTDLDISLTYDEGQYGQDRLTSVVDGSGSSQYQYDDRGLTIQENRTISGVQFNLGYSYNAARELTGTTYPSGAQVSISHDASGRLSGIQRSENGTTTDLLTNITWHGSTIGSYQQGNGLTTELIYDPAGRLTEKRFGGNDNRIQNQLDNQGQIVQQTWTHEGDQDADSFSYDYLGQLIQDGSGDWNFSYDTVGNRTSQQKTDGTVTNNYSYDIDSNRLSSINSTTVQADAAGNVLDDGNRQYQYNAMNRLAQVTNIQSGTEATYSYNYQGQRVRKQLAGNQVEEIKYVYGKSGELLGEYDASGGLIREYIYVDENSLFAVITADSSIVYIHTDHLATPRIATDESGTVIWRWDSDAFGATKPIEDPDGDGVLTVINQRFPGQYYDEETGLHYNYFRTYDPTTGRYITSDPIGLDGGLNTYAYVSNNPNRSTDPLGLLPTMPWPTGSYPPPDYGPCDYYDQMCFETGCRYYCTTAPAICHNTERIPLFWGITNRKLNCIRRCLVREDTKIHDRRNECTANDCLSDREIDNYHHLCFTECGVSPNRYPGVNPPWFPGNPNAPNIPN